VDLYSAFIEVPYLTLNADIRYVVTELILWTILSVYNSFRYGFAPTELNR